jgi:putative ABC transport system ATP-binding protein
LTVQATELRATSIGIDVDGRVLLDDVNLSVGSGQMLVITGASGTGKSILALTLAGIIEPTRGGVTIGTTRLSPLSAFNERPALVTQDFGLISVLTAEETVSLPLQVRALSREEVRERTTTWLSALGLAACATRPVTELSGGQRQRVAIARALAKGADVIVMDEPTAELDPANRGLLLSLLQIELERGAVIVVVSHEADVIAQADTVIELA